MGAGEEILKNQARIEAKLDRLLAHLGADRPADTAQQGGRVATLQETSGEHGDPKIRMVPKQWKGESFKGLRASQCSPDFLDCYADQLDWFASKSEDAKKAGWDRLDAARCRRWAVEIREGRVTQSGTAPPTPRSNGAPPQDDGDPWGDGGTSEGADW